MGILLKDQKVLYANENIGQIDVEDIPDIPTYIPVTGVSVIGSSSSLPAIVGSQLQLTAVVTPNDATNKAVSWRSSNTDLATVSGAGLVTRVAPTTSSGTVVITATAHNGVSGSKSLDVAASSSEISRIEIGCFSDTLEATENSSLLLWADVYPATANQNVTWSSSNENIAVVTASSQGEATITRTAPTTNASGTTGSVVITATSVADPSKSASKVLNVAYNSEQADVSFPPGAYLRYDFDVERILGPVYFDDDLENYASDLTNVLNLANPEAGGVGYPHGAYYIKSAYNYGNTYDGKDLWINDYHPGLMQNGALHLSPLNPDGVSDYDFYCTNVCTMYKMRDAYVAAGGNNSDTKLKLNEQPYRGPITVPFKTNEDFTVVMILSRDENNYSTTIKNGVTYDTYGPIGYTHPSTDGKGQDVFFCMDFGSRHAGAYTGNVYELFMSFSRRKAKSSVDGLNTINVCLYNGTSKTNVWKKTTKKLTIAKFDNGKPLGEKCEAVPLLVVLRCMNTADTPKMELWVNGTKMLDLTADDGITFPLPEIKNPEIVIGNSNVSDFSHNPYGGMKLPNNATGSFFGDIYHVSMFPRVLTDTELGDLLLYVAETTGQSSLPSRIQAAVQDMKAYALEEGLEVMEAITERTYDRTAAEALEHE